VPFGCSPGVLFNGGFISPFSGWPQYYHVQAFFTVYSPEVLDPPSAQGV
jgi:hypothetical protein